MSESERQTRMDDVAIALRNAWLRFPYLRLCQLIVNATGRDDPFYVEDRELIEALNSYGGSRS
jgi:hypothetical protein